MKENNNEHDMLHSLRILNISKSFHVTALCWKVVPLMLTKTSRTTFLSGKWLAKIYSPSLLSFPSGTKCAVCSSRYRLVNSLGLLLVLIFFSRSYFLCAIFFSWFYRCHLAESVDLSLIFGQFRYKM